MIFFCDCRSEATTTQDKKSLKQQREEQKKASEASGDTRAWNSLFMRQDTVCYFINIKLIYLHVSTT